MASQKKKITGVEAVFFHSWVVSRLDSKPNYSFPGDDGTELLPSITLEFKGISDSDCDSLNSWSEDHLSKQNVKRFWNAWRQKKSGSSANSEKLHLSVEAADKLRNLARVNGYDSISLFILNEL